MNKYLLMASVAIMTLGIASESWAIKCPDSAPNGSDSSSDTSKYCGVNCCWGIDPTTNVLTITPALDDNGKPYTNVVMKDFQAGTTSPKNGYTSVYETNAPWNRKGATSVVVENGITNIGKDAFQGDTKITTVTGMENVTSIGYGAFWLTDSLQSVDMPNVTTIDYCAFCGANSLTNIIIPDDVNVNNWNANAFGSSFTNNANSIITCLGDVNTCKSKLRNKYGSSIANKVQPANDTQCNSSVNYYYSSSGCVKLPNSQSSCEGAEFYWVSDKCTKTAPASSEPDPQGQQEQGGSQDSGQQNQQVSGQATSAADCAASGKYWQEGKCVSSCGASFKLNDGWCDRLRYTPAEAAQVLHDDNTNSVTITFKK